MQELRRLQSELPPDMKLAFFYDQSQFVREGVGSVWEAIILGLVLSVIVLYAFLRSLSSTIVAALVIPVTMILTLIGLRLARHELQPDDARRDRRRGRHRHRRCDRRRRIDLFQGAGGPHFGRRRSTCDARGRPGAGWQHHDARGRVHSAGVSRRSSRRVLSGAGRHDGDRLADFAGPGGDLDAGDGRTVDPSRPGARRRTNWSRAAPSCGD